MPEIYNLSTLCRCCHADGTFKSLNGSYRVKKIEEIYETMLTDTLGIIILAPPLNASYTICDKCIIKLRQASNFKKQVLQCERKFIEYCRNEQFLNTSLVLKEDIKPEIEIGNQEQGTDDDDTKLTDEENNDSDVSECKQEIKEDEQDSDVDIEQSDDISCTEDNVTSDFKEEEDPHIKENQENVTKEDQDNQNKESKNDIEETELNIDTSCIIEKQTDNGLEYSCTDCGGHYTKKNLIYRHLYTNHDSLKCKHCSKILKSVATYRKHTKKHIYPKIYQCQICNKKFNIESNFNIHMDIHSRVFTCDYCNKSFKNKSVLRKHILRHLGLNKIKLCDLCGLSFNDISNLMSHVRAVHQKLRPFACNICSKTYSAKKHLKDHLMNHTYSGTAKKGLSCEICDRKYSTLESYKLHKLTHDNIFKCKYCSKLFKGRDVLTDHINDNHVTVFPCNECGKILSTKHSLSRHINAHIGKKYTCDICFRLFSQKAMMIRHKRRVHNSEKVEKVKCTICNKNVSNIDKHMKSHDDRKFSCDMCPKSYAENNTLTRHKLQAHFGRTFDCEVCGKKYVQKSKLITHRLKVHKIKDEVKRGTVDEAG